MWIIDRIKQFWTPARETDHPLTGQERHEHRPDSLYAEQAREVNRYIAGDDDVD